MTCIFCKIANKEVKSSIVYEDNDVIAFKDLNPQAPHHMLIIPRQHIATINDITEQTANIYGRMVLAAQKVAHQLGVSDAGYRLVNNCNRDGGQTVFHIHTHFLAGRALDWPPG
jgi:histidine triad (HIT) family protein